MSLTVYAGLPGSGITEHLIGLAVRESAEGRVVVYAVPQDADAEAARSVMAARAPVGPRVATLDGIIEAEWALRGDGRRLVRGLARDVLLARALAEAGVASEPRAGLIGLLRTLCERAAATVPSDGPGAGIARDLVRAVAAYRRLVQGAGLIEHAAVCQRLGECPAPGDVIVAEGFRDLGEPQEAVLTEWAAGGAAVVIGLEWLPGHAGTEALTPLIERLRAAGADVQILPADRGEYPDDLQRARADLFAGPQPAPGCGAVRLVVAEGHEAEARAITQAVSDLLQEGAQPEEIVVVFADPARHAAWMRRSLRDLGIVASIAVPVAVGETPFGAALLALRASASGDVARPELGSLMRSPFGGVSAHEADLADLAWRKSGVVRGRALLRRAGGVRGLVEAARGLADARMDGVVAAKWKKLADTLLSNAHPGAAPVPGTEAALDAAVHRAFCRSLQEALDLGEPGVSAEEFWERFARMHVVPPLGRGPVGVRVVGLGERVGDAVKHVIVGGLTASECPRRGSEDRLEGDAVSRALRLLGITVETEEHLREERRAFFLAVASAHCTLTLTRAETNAEGSPLRESVFWDEFLDLYRAPGTELDPDSDPRLGRIAAEAGATYGVRRSRRGALASPDAVEALAGITEVSPSEVETYASCPYRWFVEKRLRASAPDTEIDPAAAGRIAHDALARFYQARIERGAGRVSPAECESAAKEAERIAAELVDAAVGAESLEGLALLQSVPPAVAALVARDAAFLPGYSPVRIEWSFGGRAESPAIDLGGVALKGRADRIDAGPGGLVVVDYKRTVASSLSEMRSKGLVQLQLYAAAASRELGLPVVGGIYRGLRDGSDRGFVSDEISDLGRFYAADVVGADDLAELIGDAVTTAVQAASDMRSGRIEPTPSAVACRYCAASSFCSQAVS